MEEVEPVPIAGNRLVWRHIQKELALVQMLEKNFSISQGLNKEELKMTLDPLGYDPIIDIDETHSRNRRKTDDPYIRATMKNADHIKWKNNPAERR